MFVATYLDYFLQIPREDGYLRFILKDQVYGMFFAFIEVIILTDYLSHFVELQGSLYFSKHKTITNCKPYLTQSHR